MVTIATAALPSAALLSCSSPAKPAPTTPASASQQSAPPTTAPKLDFTFDDEPLDSTAGFALDTPGATLLRVAEDEERGGRVLALSSVQTLGPVGTRAGLVLAPEAVAALRGRRVAISAALDPNGTAPFFGMFGLDLQRSDDSLMRFRSNKTSDRGWETLRITADIPADAKNLGVWFYQSAEGELRLDDLHLRDVGPPGTGDVPPRAITARGMQNLLALARLYGAVRYFHPSDEAAAADWDRLLLDAIEPVERAADATELAARLSAIFQPVAPAMTIAAGDQAPRSDISDVAPRGAHSQPMFWIHRGVQMPSSLAKIYQSKRVTTMMEPSDMVMQAVDVSARRGQTLQLSAFLRLADTQGVLVVASTNKEPEPAHVAVPPPPKPNQWTQVKLAVKIPDDADQLFVMVRMNGPGQFSIDDASLRGPATEELLVNGDFEQASGSIFPYGWTTALANLGYELRVESKGCHRGKGCASMTAPRPPQRRPGEAVVMKLPGGVTAAVPLVVWSLWDEHTYTTVPRGTGFQAPSQPHYAVVTDRSTRLASVIELWNVLQHFYPNFDVVKVDWMAQLPIALAAAATNASEDQFVETLERLTHELRDGHARVTPSNGYRGELPIKLQLVEGHWMITGLDPRALAQGGASGTNPITGGEELISLDGQPVDKLAAALRPRTSAATPQFEDVVVAQRLLTGDIGKSATVKVRRATGEESTLQLAYTLFPALREVARPVTSTELEPGIWYVDAAEVQEPWLMMQLPALAAARGVILDLRGYTNRPSLFQHLTNKPVATPWWLIPITIKPDREGTSFLKVNTPLAAVAPQLKGKIVVLADGRTLSATETYLSIIKHYKLGTIVGETSAGTNGDINPIALPSGHTVNWTGLRVQDPSGKPHHGAGVAPDVKVTPTVAGVRARRDEVLERGLELIRGPKPATAAPARP